MKKILFITTTPTVDGNGDAIINEGMITAEIAGAEVKRINIREKNINFCKACYGCKNTGICVQRDDFFDVLKHLHEADGIIVEAPVYYNCMAAQALTVINRLCCTFAYPEYKIGLKKKIGIFLTCTGSSVDEMERHVGNIMTLPSISRSIAAYRTIVFNQCVEKDTCKQSPQYMEIVHNTTQWVCE